MTDLTQGEKRSLCDEVPESVKKQKPNPSSSEVHVLVCLVILLIWVRGIIRGSVDVVVVVLLMSIRWTPMRSQV